MLAGEESADLIEPLISGLVEDPLWSTFLHRLRALTAADYTSIVFRQPVSGPGRDSVVHLYAGQAWPSDISQLYRETPGISDPMPYQDMAAGRVYALPELLRYGDPEHDSYRYQFLIPGGMSVLRMMRVAEESGVSAWLSVSRRQDEFAPDVDALIASLAPYLRAALHSYVALERERITATVANEAIRRMNFGWLTLDAQGRVLDADAHGAVFLEDSGILFRGKGGRLSAKAKDVDREIAGAIAALSGDGPARPRAIVLSREPWLDMLLVPATIHAGTTRPAPALFAYVHADKWSSADRCDQLAQLFDLVPSEARLALALSRGMSIAEAAVELGLTVESARTYSKRIYAKTGARGQADLVRFIHRSVLAIA